MNNAKSRISTSRVVFVDNGLVLYQGSDLHGCGMGQGEKPVVRLHSVVQILDVQCAQPTPIRCLINS